MKIESKFYSLIPLFPKLQGDSKGFLNDSKEYDFISMEQIHEKIFPILSQAGLRIIQKSYSKIDALSPTSQIVGVENFVTNDDGDIYVLSSNEVSVHAQTGMSMMHSVAAYQTFLRRTTLINDLQLFMSQPEKAVETTEKSEVKPMQDIDSSKREVKTGSNEWKMIVANASIGKLDMNLYKFSPVQEKALKNLIKNESNNKAVSGDS